ncbi:MAG: hypothetical protein WCB92_04400, partial [Mycobacterium sp.]
QRVHCPQPQVRRRPHRLHSPRSFRRSKTFEILSPDDTAESRWNHPFRQAILCGVVDRRLARVFAGFDWH